MHKSPKAMRLKDESGNWSLYMPSWAKEWDKGMGLQTGEGNSKEDRRADVW